MAGLTELFVEDAALPWLESIGWSIRNGAERDDYGQVVLVRRLRHAA